MRFQVVAFTPDSLSAFLGIVMPMIGELCFSPVF